MKLIIPAVIGLVSAGRDWVNTKPANRCSDITKPQQGMWIDMGHPDINIKMNPGCTAEDSSRCTVWCTGFQQHLIFDRTKEDKNDKRILADKQKKLLIRCMCEVMGQDENGDILENCKWTRRTRWSQKDYEEEQNSNRMKRSMEDPRATVYCEDDTSQEIQDTWNIKEPGTGRLFKNNKGYDDCGDMEEAFPDTGGEWKCKDEDKNKLEGSVAPFKGSCTFGCRNSEGKWISKDARFTCYRPWIGYEDWADKPLWRRFKGLGTRVYRQSLLNCD